MTDRQEYILKTIVDHFITSVEPVGSRLLVEEKGMNVSGATVRNEMRELEDLGYLTHPHTSAGRIPTEQGYQYYVEHLMDEYMLKGEVKDTIQQVMNDETVSTNKKLAQLGSSWAGVAAILGIGTTGYYYTGLANLFSQPEFQDSAKTLDMSRLFDQCEMRIPEMMHKLEDDTVHVFIGSQNPLGTVCGTVTLLINEEPWLFIGPMRMNYAKCIAMANHLKSQLT